MMLTQSPVSLHESAGPTPWSALVLRLFRRFRPFSQAIPFPPCELFLQWSPTEAVLGKWARFRFLDAKEPRLLEEVVLDRIATQGRPVWTHGLRAEDRQIIPSAQSQPVFLPGLFVGIEFPIASVRCEERLFKPYGVALDSFCIDDGGFEPKSIWEIDAGSFPQGFSRLEAAARRMNSNLGLWVSPSIAKDVDWAKAAGYETRKTPQRAAAGLLKWARANAAILKRTVPLLPAAWQQAGIPRLTDQRLGLGVGGKTRQSRRISQCLAPAGDNFARRRSAGSDNRDCGRHTHRQLTAVAGVPIDSIVMATVTYRKTRLTGHAKMQDTVNAYTRSN